MKKKYKEVIDDEILEAKEPSAGKPYVFHFADHLDSNILFGAFREEKNQLDWILGENPSRNEILYNVRVNSDLFSVRDGGISDDNVPEYVLIYDYKNASYNYHLFPCFSSSIKREDEMAQMNYPEPNGDYMVYQLGNELLKFRKCLTILISDVAGCMLLPGRQYRAPARVTPDEVWG